MIDQIDPQMIKDIIETRHINKHKRNTAQSYRDHDRIVNRMNRIGIKMDFVSAFLEKTFKEKLTTSFLLGIANALMSKLNIPIDRLAKRNRTALLCWYAEHWEEISPHIPQYIELTKSHSENSCYSLNPLDISQLLNSH